MFMIWSKFFRVREDSFSSHIYRTMDNIISNISTTVSDIVDQTSVHFQNVNHETYSHKLEDFLLIGNTSDRISACFMSLENTDSNPILSNCLLLSRTISRTNTFADGFHKYVLKWDSTGIR